VLEYVILPKAAICVQKVSGDLGNSASCSGSTETYHGRSPAMYSMARYIE
jgi:hypothetical protein